jgi:hypothetical protein
MESWKWRYHPEFRIQLLVNGLPAEREFNIVSVNTVRNAFKNYGLITRDCAGGIDCHQLQKPDGSNWVPMVDMTEPTCFDFWLLPKAGVDISGLAFFANADPVFGRSVLYADNLDNNGDIDSAIVGGVMPLNAGPSVGSEERASVSHPIVSTDFTAGAYTEIRAGKIRAGSAIVFTESEAIDINDTSASLDFSSLNPGVWRVELVGLTPVIEPVVIDPQFARSDALGHISIYRDAWLTPAQPREYQLNFST